MANNGFVNTPNYEFEKAKEMMDQLKKDIKMMETTSLAFTPTTTYITNVEKRISRNFQDPCMRNAVLVDFLNNIFELLSTVGESMFQAKMIDIDERIDQVKTILSQDQHKIQLDVEKLKVDLEHLSHRSLNLSKYEKQITESKNKMDELFYKLQQWVQAPIYSPDHPFGKQIVDQIGTNLQNISKKDNNNNQ